MTDEMLKQHERMFSDGRVIFHHMSTEMDGSPIGFIEQANKQGLPWTTFWYNYMEVDNMPGAETVAVWRAKPKKQSS